ncbi:hypothetical protein ACT1U9_20110 [Streptomyces sp. BR1]|uniref:hypothetical protein n=1 Tax=Streptomyces sp. BR1 TaxID=1592323 RepID=UPI00402B1204
MNKYSVLPLLLIAAPLLYVLAAAGVVPWAAVVGVVIALGLLAVVARKGRAPRPGGG